MQLIDYIDYWEIFKKVKKNQLEQFPTAKSYIKELKYFDEPFDYVEEMYAFLLADYTNDFEMITSDSHDDSILSSVLDENKLLIELSEGGNNATENGDDYWGYGLRFIVDMENELFVGYSYENYS